MYGFQVSQCVRDAQVAMARIACQTIIRPNEETLDPDDGDYISGPDAEPETEEEEEDHSTTKPIS